MSSGLTSQPSSQFWSSVKTAGHAAFRFLRAASVLGPIYITYLWVWLFHIYLKHPIDHEALDDLHRKNARAFYELALCLRGGLIKAGQMISARVDIVPRVWTKELQKLQDRVEPTPWDTIHAHLRDQYGAPPEQIFSRIDPDAAAAASFGQVHRAVTRDGLKVALKVRYPDIPPS